METGEDNDPKNGREGGFEKTVTGMLLLTTYAIAFILIVGGGMIHKKGREEEPVSAPYAAPPVPMEPAALEALEAFFEAPDLATKVALVRDGVRVRPMMHDFHETRGHAFPSLGRVSPGQAAEFDGKPMVVFEVEPFSGPRYFAAVVWDGRRFAVDWESLTAYGTMDWVEFTEGKPATPQTMRVFLRQAGESDRPPGYYGATSFFRIEHRDHLQPLIAAAEGVVASALMPMVDKRRTPVTLELAWKTRDGEAEPILWVRSLVSQGWSP